MPAVETKKRKACESCTKAKAKCSPSRCVTDVCQRCERLSKECIFGDSLRKRGPQSRSRMKQLEQRVQSIVEILTVGDQATDQLPHRSTRSSQVVDGRVKSLAAGTQPCMTPIESPHQPSKSATEGLVAYDPVEAGLLREDKATELFDDFRQQHPHVFPFVVLDKEVTMETFRLQQPFLFLSIMAAMSYQMPSTQRLLGDAFRDQIAARVVGASHKGLEMLQGLLIHTAYYHYFYRPGNQQLSLMVHLCVATAQDFGLSKKWRDHHSSSCSSFDTSLAGQRAILGTYYLAAAFAHAWRKRCTMHYTRTLSRSCRTFATSSEHPSDILIAPLIHASELMTRINANFSYDEIRDSEIMGETMIGLSTSNFSAELQRLRDTTPEVARHNMSVRIAFDVLDVLIHECSIHTPLWTVTSPDHPNDSMPPLRIQMLQRSISASRALCNIFLSAPFPSLHYLAFSSWSNWFYSVLLVVKTVVFQRTGSTGSSSCIHNTPHAVGDVIPQEYGESATQAICTMTTSRERVAPLLGDQPATAEEEWLISTFEGFLEKLAASTIPTDGGEQYSRETAFVKPFLNKVATLQRGLLLGLRKITGPRNGASPNQQGDNGGATTSSPGYGTASDQPELHHPSIHDSGNISGEQPLLSFDEVTHWDYFNDPTSFSDFTPIHPTPSDDWLWNMVLNDGSNMFTL